jgi:hypothetical protein
MIARTESRPPSERGRSPFRSAANGWWSGRRRSGPATLAISAAPTPRHCSTRSTFVGGRIVRRPPMATRALANLVAVAITGGTEDATGGDARGGDRHRGRGPRNRPGGRRSSTLTGDGLAAGSEAAAWGATTATAMFVPLPEPLRADASCASSRRAGTNALSERANHRRSQPHSEGPRPSTYVLLLLARSMRCPLRQAASVPSADGGRGKEGTCDGT